MEIKVEKQLREMQKIFAEQVSQVYVHSAVKVEAPAETSSICFRAVCLACLYFAIWGKSIPVLLGVIENFGLTYESFSEIPSGECSVEEGDLESEGSRFRGASRSFCIILKLASEADG
uniref:Uncharacterized protein n=1 Tax=Glossina pallidipes TaxID=7398 RepID=A0A1B0ACA8_GLOPL